jgi:hypothetical protein
MTRSNLYATLAALALAGMIGMTSAAQAQSAIPGATKTTTTDAALRDLWLGHVFWVRGVVVATIAGNTPAAEAAEKSVVANAKAIAAAFEPYYGKDASAKLFELLAGHYGAVKQYLAATVAASKPRQDAAFKALTDNAAAIAKFLSGANPNLPYETLNVLLMAHGGHHVQQIEELKDKKYGEEAETWEAMKTHMYTIADALTGGLTKQFPEKF